MDSRRCVISPGNTRTSSVRWRGHFETCWRRSCHDAQDDPCKERHADKAYRARLDHDSFTSAFVRPARTDRGPEALRRKRRDRAWLGTEGKGWVGRESLLISCTAPSSVEPSVATSGAKVECRGLCWVAYRALHYRVSPSNAVLRLCRPTRGPRSRTRTSDPVLPEPRSRHCWPAPLRRAARLPCARSSQRSGSPPPSTRAAPRESRRPCASA